LHESTLGQISESLYRTRDVDTARGALRTNTREPVRAAIAGGQK
jgi:hypothetical protein